MTEDQKLAATVYDGWHEYQSQIVGAIAPLNDEQLALRAAPHLRSVGEMSTHIIGARARWLMGLTDEQDDNLKAFSRWDRPGEKTRSAAELAAALEFTWAYMRDAISGWTAEQWADTWPGEDDSEPATITRQWVIWHLIEHDLYHGGEISLTLGAHGVPALEL